MLFQVKYLYGIIFIFILYYIQNKYLELNILLSFYNKPEILEYIYNYLSIP